MQTGADAIHPGYGFLAESPDFAEAVEAAGLVFVGPTPDSLRRGGDKLAAKAIARGAGVPVVAEGDPAEIGFPLVIKAAAGGGGRGMRVVREPGELDEALAAARREAEAAFGDERVFCEHYVERPRHVEVQLLGDGAGTVMSLGERECSIQRRHQKVLEESPSLALDADLRDRMSEAAVAFAQAIGYRSAGTAEFMLDGRSFYFLELNGRIQVEHPVTELVTGVDLVAEQLSIAAGGPVASSYPATGHAVEVRLYAEDPVSFLPQAGRITRLRLPEGVRVDAGVEEGDEVGTAYDPMIAKLIAHGETRDEALDRLGAALESTAVEGVTTNLPFLRWLVRHPALREGDTTTAFLVEHPPLSAPPARRANRAWRGSFRLNLPSPPPASPPDVDAAQRQHGGVAVESVVTAPMPGTVIRVLVGDGDAVKARQPLLVLEAMKMETPLVSPYEAVVRRVHVSEGDRVAAGDAPRRARGVGSAREGASKCGGSLGERVVRAADHAGHAEEAVDHAVVAGERDRDAGVLEPPRVRLSLVPQRIELGRHHERRRRVGQVGRAKRRRVRLEAVSVREVVVPEPAHSVRGQVIAVRELAVGGRVQVGVAHGIDQQLERERQPRVAGAQCADGGQVPARAVAADRERPRPSADLFGVLRDPGRRSPGVVERRREAVLGGEPVVDRADDAAGEAGERRADAVVRDQAAQHPAAAVEVHEHRCGLVPGPVDARRDPTGRTGHGALLPGHLDDRPEHGIRGSVSGRPRFVRGQLADAGHAELLELVEERPGLWVEWH